MSEIIVSDVQSLNPADDRVELFEIQISESPDTWIYLCNEYYTPSSSTKVTMRDKTTTSQINTYQVIPIAMEEVERTMDGSLPRPELKVANVFRTQDNTSFSGAIYVANSNSAIPYDDILGLKVIKRTTLSSYLYNNDTQDPPIEFPVEVWYLDRVVEENNLEITFELVAPYDLQGVTIPRRNVISTGCSWEYQGAGDHLAASAQKGGCFWNEESKYTVDGTEYTVYVNKDDEHVVSLTDGNFTTWAGSGTADSFYKTTGTTADLINSDGTITSGSAVTDYWQCKTATSDTPADNHSDWIRLRLYTTYSSATQYVVYLDDKYNSYVSYNDSGTTRLWKAKYRTQDANAHATSPIFNRYWERGDVCGKRLNSCVKRFGFNPDNGLGLGYKGKAANRDETVLPFGGFPSSRTFE